MSNTLGLAIFFSGKGSAQGLRHLAKTKAMLLRQRGDTILQFRPRSN